MVISFRMMAGSGKHRFSEFTACAGRDAEMLVDSDLKFLRSAPYISGISTSTFIFIDDSTSQGMRDLIFEIKK